MTWEMYNALLFLGKTFGFIKSHPSVIDTRPCGRAAQLYHESKFLDFN